VRNGDCEVKFIAIERQLGDFFTKPLSKDTLFFFRNELGILDSNSILNVFFISPLSLFVKTNKEKSLCGLYVCIVCLFLL